MRSQVAKGDVVQNEREGPELTAAPDGAEGLPSSARPIAAGLFVWPSPPEAARLLASRCPECADVSFPAVPHCRMPACALIETEPFQIGGTGRVISATVQRYQPPGPFGQRQPFQPIPIALVEFEAGIAVLGVVKDWDGEPIPSGSQARLVLTTLYPGEDGAAVVGWAYQLEGRP